jgi:hypothetical protein
MSKATLATIDLPDFDIPSSMPELYRARLEAARAVREHSANLSHLTGFDPRFEEALLFPGRDGDPFFGLFLNPGHLLGLDEWVSSPVAPGSQVELRSGMAIQVDIIPATGTDCFTTNVEGSLALADKSLRASFALQYPEAWARITARRAFMGDQLGIEPHPDVLPFSNLPVYLPPFLLRPDQAMRL